MPIRFALTVLLLIITLILLAACTGTGPLSPATPFSAISFGCMLQAVGAT